jgi:RNA polymerase sigma-70 factor (ECF subfamily)
MPAQNTTTNDRQNPGDVKRLYERYRHQLRQFFVLRGQAEQADDLMQQMFLELTRRPPPAQLRDPQAYLFQVAWNALHALGRRERREPPEVSVSDARSLDEQTRRFDVLRIEDDSTTLLAQESVTRILRQLPHAVRVAILRRYRDGRTYREIAAELACTTHTVKKYISRGLLHFRSQLTESDTSRRGAHG